MCHDSFGPMIPAVSRKNECNFNQKRGPPINKGLTSFAVSRIIF